MPRSPAKTGPHIAFGRELRRYRERAHLTQVDLSRRAGISDSYGGLLENGIYQPTPRVLRDLCRVLEADYNFLAAKLGWIRPDADAAADVAEFQSYPRSKRRAILDWLASWDLRRDDAEMGEEEGDGDGEHDDEDRGR